MTEETSLDARPVEGTAKRTAEDYANAANMVIDIAALAASFIPGGGAIATAARAVATNAPKAKIAAKTLSPVVPIVAPIANKAKEAVAKTLLRR